MNEALQLPQEVALNYVSFNKNVDWKQEDVKTFFSNGRNTKLMLFQNTISSFLTLNQLLMLVFARYKVT